MLAVASALLCALSVRSLASPVLTLVALAPIFVATQRVTPRLALGLGWLTASIATLIGYAFVPPALSATGSLSVPLAWGALAGFALFRGAWLGLALGLAALAGSRRSLLLSAVLVTASELVLPNPLPFAFGTPLVMWPAIAQLASVFGASGLTLIAALCSAGVAALVTTEKRDWGRTWVVIAVGLAAPTLAALFGLTRLSQVEPREQQLEATLLHTMRDPLAPGALPALPLGQSLLVLPESALPLPVPETDADVLARELVGAHERPVLLGLSERASSGRLRNVALFFEPHQSRAAGRYEKQELLPFAEAAFDRGRATDPIEIAGAPISVAICSEELDAGVIRASVRERHSQAIIALSNDAWFQGSYAAELHLLAARARAIETGRSILRASNGGTTAAVDPHGRVIARTTTPGPLEVSAPLSTEPTSYLRFGNAPLWLLLAALAALSLSRRKPGADRRAVDVEPVP
jgi:apolipoprotein N-acyltransferase